METADEGLGSECSSESGSVVYRGMETAVSVADNNYGEALPRVAGSSIRNSVEINRTEKVRSYLNCNIGCNRNLNAENEPYGTVFTEETNFRTTNVRFIVFGEQIEDNRPVESPERCFVDQNIINGNVKYGEKNIENGKSPRNISEYFTGSSCELSEPEPCKYITVWKTTWQENVSYDKTKRKEESQTGCTCVKAINHFVFTPSVFSTVYDSFMSPNEVGVLSYLFFIQACSIVSILVVG